MELKTNMKNQHEKPTSKTNNKTNLETQHSKPTTKTLIKINLQNHHQNQHQNQHHKPTSDINISLDHSVSAFILLALGVSCLGTPQLFCHIRWRAKLVGNSLCVSSSRSENVSRLSRLLPRAFTDEITTSPANPSIRPLSELHRTLLMPIGASLGSHMDVWHSPESLLPPKVGLESTLRNGDDSLTHCQGQRTFSLLLPCLGV